MAIEIERKFLVKNTEFLKGLTGEKYQQAYLNSEKERTVRIRITGDRAYLTIKGKNEGFSRKEFEYKIPYTDGKELIALCPRPFIEKVRYKLAYEGKIWEVDVFEHDNEGLIVAEIELNTSEEYFEKPEWLGEEVTADERYYNSNLSKYPYTDWEKN